MALNPEVQLRRQQAYQLRLAGYSINEMAAILKVSEPRACQLVIERIAQLSKLDAGLADRQRKIQLSRMNAALKAIWPSVLVGSPGHIDMMLKLPPPDAY